MHKHKHPLLSALTVTLVPALVILAMLVGTFAGLAYAGAVPVGTPYPWDFIAVACGLALVAGFLCALEDLYTHAFVTRRQHEARMIRARGWTTR